MARCSPNIPYLIPSKNYFSRSSYILLLDGDTDPGLSRLSRFNTGIENANVKSGSILKSLTEHFKYVTTKCTIKGWDQNVKSLLFVDM